MVQNQDGRSGQPQPGAPAEETLLCLLESLLPLLAEDEACRPESTSAKVDIRRLVYSSMTRL